MLDLLRQALGVVVALALVSTLAWLAIWLLKRLQLASAPGAPASDLRFVRALPLGPRERLVVVEWRGETLLLGVTAGGVSLVKTAAAGAASAEPSFGRGPT